jgi:hypothetical protein
MPGLTGLETAGLTRLKFTQAEKAMQIAVKPVSPDLHESFVTLLIELHAFYNQPQTASPEEIRAHLRENLLPQRHHVLQLTWRPSGGRSPVVPAFKPGA